MPRSSTITTTTPPSLAGQSPEERQRPRISVDFPDLIMVEIESIEGKGVLARGVLRERCRAEAQEAIANALKGRVLAIAHSLLAESLGGRPAVVGPVGVVEAHED